DGEEEAEVRRVSQQEAMTEHLHLETERVLLVRDALELLPSQLDSEFSSPKTTDTDLIRRILNFYLDKAWSKSTPPELRPMVYEDALKFCQRVKRLDIQNPALRRSLGLTTALALYLSKAYPLAHEVFSRVEAQSDQEPEKREHLLEERIERSLKTLMTTRGFHRIRALETTTIADVTFRQFRLEGEIDSRQAWEEETWIEVLPDSGLGRIFALVSVPTREGVRNWFFYSRTSGQEKVVKAFGQSQPGYQIRDEILQHLTATTKKYAPSEFNSVIDELDEKLRDVEQSIRELEARPPSMSPLDLVGDGTAFISAQVTGMIRPQTFVHPIRLEALLSDGQKRELRKTKMLPIRTRDGWVKVHYHWAEELIHITKVESE
ncbi:MAG: hypothetical protein QGF00_30060, partial [Planctomycetota bacterium]|nr:hypothetical protein [Planctomycetota bacterium]